MKKTLLFVILLFVLCIASYGQINVIGQEALKKYNTLNQQDYFKRISTELLEENQSLKSQNQKLNKENNYLKGKNEELELMMAYIKFRELIETNHSNTTNNTIYSIFGEDTLGYFVKNGFKINKVIINLFGKYNYSEHQKLFDFNNQTNTLLFPKSYELYKSKILELNFINQEEIVRMNVTRTPFPSVDLMPENKTADKQKKTAENYMNTIVKISQSNMFDFDVMRLYNEIEKKEASGKEINQLIKVREKYIIFLKKLYDEKK